MEKDESCVLPPLPQASIIFSSDDVSSSSAMLDKLANHNKISCGKGTKILCKGGDWQLVSVVQVSCGCVCYGYAFPKFLAMRPMSFKSTLLSWLTSAIGFHL